MADDINLNDLLRTYRAHPFEDLPVSTPHSGLITLKVLEGDDARGPAGQWQQRPGTLLYLLEREGNTRKVTAPCAGQVAGVRTDLDGSFVEAATQVLSIRHRLGREDIIDRILTHVLVIFPAPQAARYYLSPEVAAALEKVQEKGVAIKSGDEPVIMSLMKRDTLLSYDGASGVIYRVYFTPGALVEEGAPLLGICPHEKLFYVQKVIQRIRTEWEE